MFDYFFPMALSVLFQILNQAITDEELKKRIRRAMLKLRDQINLAYGQDQDFVVNALRLYNPVAADKVTAPAEEEKAPAADATPTRNEPDPE